MKKIINKTVLSFLFLLAFTLSFSQTLPPPPERELAGGPEKQDIPIDHFEIFLVCIAITLIAYSSKRFYKKII